MTVRPPLPRQRETHRSDPAAAPVATAALDYLDLGAAAALSLATVLVQALPSGVLAPLRTATSLVFLLLVPGYALAATLFPRRSDAAPVERLVASLGLSVALVPLCGLVLDATPLRIELRTMLPLLLAVTALALAAAAVRRRGLAPGTAFYSRLELPALRRYLTLFGVVAGLFAGTVATVVLVRPPDATTAFYVLGEGGRLASYPDRLAPGERFEVTVGIENHDGATGGYRVRASFGELVSETVAPPLQEGAVWEGVLELRAPPGSGRVPLLLELYRPGDAGPYRTLTIYLTLAEASLERGLPRA